LRENRGKNKSAHVHREGAALKIQISRYKDAPGEHKKKQGVAGVAAVADASKA